MCTCVGNQQSRGVVIARLRSSAQSLLHQRRDLHQLTYFYRLKDRESTPHQVVSDFMLPVRYYHVLYSYFLSLYQAPPKKPKKLYTFRCPIALRAQSSFFSCFVEFIFIVVESCC
jgi:hypothetical protein